MRNQISSTRNNQNYFLRKRNKAELHRNFVDLQFKRSELEKQLKRVIEILFSLGREI